MDKVIQVKKKGGLKAIKTPNGSVNASIFTQKHKDENSGGEPSGSYKSSGLPGTKQYISPTWNRGKKQWCWGGTVEDLERLITELKLKYEAGHPQEGRFIDKENAESRLYNYADEVFNHSRFYGVRFLESGSLTLRNTDPIEKFLYFCFIADPSTERPNDTRSKYSRLGAKYQLVSPKQETIEKANNVDKDLEAIEFLIAMVNDEERMRTVCTVMDLPGFSLKTSEPSAMKVLLKEAATDETAVARYNNKSVQERFVEVCSMNDEELYIISNVIKAKKNSFLQKRTNHFLFQGVKLDGLLNDNDLVAYFKNPANTEQYMNLLKALETLEKK